MSRLEFIVRTPPSGIKKSSRDILLDPAIPLVGKKLVEPLREAFELFGAKLRHGDLKLLNAHCNDPGYSTNMAQEDLNG